MEDEIKRQGMTVTVNQLRKLADELERECRQLNLELANPIYDYDHQFQINIINKTPKCSDTWKIEEVA